MLADDPQLTCRLPGYKQVPMVRVIADGHLRSPLTAKAVVTASEDPTWMLVGAGSDRNRRQDMMNLGVRLIEIPGGDRGLDLARALAELAGSGITSVLVEGGAKLSASLLQADLVDRLAWFHAPAVMGGDGLPAAAAFGVEGLASMPRFRRLASQMLGNDMLSEWAKD